MRLLLALALLLAGCDQPQPAQPTPAPTPVLADIPTPGLSLEPNPWRWNQQPAPSVQLSALLELETLEAVQSYLVANIPWQDDYDIMQFLSPNEVLEQRRTVCTGFARIWQAYLAHKHGIRADFVAFFGPETGHAVAVFRAPDGRMRLASNQFFYKALDLDPGNQGREVAWLNAGAEFYGTGVRRLMVFDDGGAIRQQFINEKATQAPTSTSPGRNLFTVRR